MQKLLIASIAFLFITPGIIFAQTSETKPVAFRVELGDLLCKDGSGTASVLFATDPKEGGYFSIIGDMIDQNKITLDRRVVLKSGKYTWKGTVNQGYHETPPSIGEFTIPECNADSPAVSPISPAKQPPVTAATQEPEAQKAAENITENNDVSNASSSEILDSDATDNSVPEPNQTSTFKWVIFGLVVLGVGIGIFARKKPAQ